MVAWVAGILRVRGRAPGVPGPSGDPRTWSQPLADPITAVGFALAAGVLAWLAGRETGSHRRVLMLDSLVAGLLAAGCGLAWAGLPVQPLLGCAEAGAVAAGLLNMAWVCLGRGPAVPLRSVAEPVLRPQEPEPRLASMVVNLPAFSPFRPGREAARTGERLAREGCAQSPASPTPDGTGAGPSEPADLERQKLASLGLLSGGIAHDFNNLLAAMVGNLDLLKLEAGGEWPSRLVLQEDLLARAAQLVGQILAYAGKGRGEVRPLDLNQQAGEMVRLLRASLVRRAEVVWEPGPGLPPVLGDPGQVNQVILNLVVNAGEAVPSDTGRILVRTRVRRLAPDDLERTFLGQGLQPGTYASLEVVDNGPGIPAAARGRIFEPFFTTKVTGRGLGLAAVQGIVRGHGGGIRLESEPGRGTTFEVALPAAQGPAPDPAGTVLPPPPAQAWQPARDLAVLVVDDEDVLRLVACSAVRRLGLRPLEARDGQEALVQFEAHRQAIGLILLDLTMPNLGGDATYRRLRRAGALAPVLLCSGFDRDAALARFRGQGLAGYLAKPYNLDTFYEALRAGLGRAEHPCRPGERAPLAWRPEYELGLPELDQGHRRLLEVFNGVQAAPAAAALRPLCAAAAEHFRAEEALLERGDPHQARRHRDLHARLEGLALDLSGRLERGGQALTPAVLDFLEDWLLSHIRWEDADWTRS